MQFLRAIRPEEARGFRRAAVPVDAPVAGALDPAALAGALEYPGDDATKQQLAAWLAASAQKAGLPPELPVMAALVESGVANLRGGDADSVGFFQMRVGIWNKGEYAGYPDNPALQMKWFIDHALAVKQQRIAAGDAGFGKDPVDVGQLDRRHRAPRRAVPRPLPGAARAGPGVARQDHVSARADATGLPPGRPEVCPFASCPGGPPLVASVLATCQRREARKRGSAVEKRLGSDRPAPVWRAGRAGAALALVALAVSGCMSLKENKVVQTTPGKVTIRTVVCASNFAANKGGVRARQPLRGRQQSRRCHGRKEGAAPRRLPRSDRR